MVFEIDLEKIMKRTRSREFLKNKRAALRLLVSTGWSETQRILARNPAYHTLCISQGINHLHLRTNHLAEIIS